MFTKMRENLKKPSKSNVDILHQKKKKRKRWWIQYQKSKKGQKCHFKPSASSYQILERHKRPRRYRQTDYRSEKYENHLWIVCKRVINIKQTSKDLCYSEAHKITVVLWEAWKARVLFDNANFKQEVLQQNWISKRIPFKQIQQRVKSCPLQRPEKSERSVG